MFHHSHSRRSRRAFAIGGSAIVALLALSGCTAADAAAKPAPSADAELTDGGTLDFGVSGDPGNLDPTFAVTLTSSIIYQSMCDRLFQYDEDGAAFPQLAAEPVSFNEDGTVATVTLREGVTFADGTPMDAAAVAATLERYQTAPGSQRAIDLTNLTAVEAVDATTVTLTFDSPMPEGAFYDTFADRTGIPLSPTALAAGDDAFSQHPVCVGAFAFDSRVAQDNVTLVKDPNYYRADEVHLDSIVYKVLPDSSVRTTNLRSGDLQVIYRVSTIDAATLETTPGVEVHTQQSTGHDYFMFNLGNTAGASQPAGELDKPWVKDPKVRQAFELAIDRDALNTIVYNGMYTPTCGFMAPQQALATASTLECAPADLDEAKKLLKESGVDLPIKASLVFSNSPEYRRMAETVQQMVAEAGFELELNPQESTASISMIQDGDFDIYLGTWTGGADPTISRFVQSTDPSNYGRYASADVDRLLAEAGSEVGQDKRAALYAEIDAILREDMPLVFLLRPQHINAYSDTIGGLEFRFTGAPAPAFAGYLAE
ncbi:ABC transporter substrate-binding protein [Microbacterium sp. MYb62]|uniref:ABC transporter substrate-binding protein n=1 Tax=Microbacterium sp. MYb62 TaxID=1848690 RepID=UPI0015E4408A|nr:ABC transporter substrate-binding protein [Microbacterium sp. MYb62]